MDPVLTRPDAGTGVSSEVWSVARYGADYPARGSAMTLRGQAMAAVGLNGSQVAQRDSNQLTVALPLTEDEFLRSIT